MKRTILATLTCLLLSAQVSFAQPAQPDICLVTVDDLSTHNIIIWDKTGYVNVDYFVIYRQDAAGSFISIDSVAFDSLSIYHDYGFDPNVESVKYKISCTDNMGMASPQSDYHEVIFCDEPTLGHFEWNLYDVEGGATAPQFIMMRKDNSTAPWLPIDTVASSTIMFDDAAALSFPNGEWRVRTLWPAGTVDCEATRAGVSTSRSNIRVPAMVIGVRERQSKDQFLVYPNPATSMVGISMYDGSNASAVRVLNLYGQVVYNMDVNTNIVRISTEGWDNGVYYIEVSSGNSKQVKSFVKI